MNIRKVLTHSGVFHADEVFAIAALKICHPIMITRSRDEVEIEKADLVVDVGGKFDGVKFFDHHQKGFSLARENGIKYSSFGLIWNFYCNQYASDEVRQIVDTKLVQIIDAVDNGQECENFGYSDTISGFNPQWDDENADPDSDFCAALGVARRILQNAINSARSEILARDIVRAAPIRAGILTLEKFCPWQDVVIREMPDVKFVVFPDRSGEWRVQTVPMAVDTFISRKMLPLEWAGLRDNDLNLAAGIEDAVFCHNGRFIAGAKSKESILKMAMLAAEN